MSQIVESKTRPLTPKEAQDLAAFVRLKEGKYQKMLDEKSMVAAPSMQGQEVDEDGFVLKTDKVREITIQPIDTDKYRITEDGQVGIVGDSEEQNSGETGKVHLIYLMDEIKAVLQGRELRRAREIQQKDSAMDGQSE
jgi:hypothetical protein